jgi:hypothetical protein
MNSNSIEIGQIRKFGLVALLFFGCLSFMGFWTGKPLPTYLFGCLSILGFGFIVIPKPLKPIYSGWLKIAHFIGRAVTTVVLALAYYIVITPAALIKRIFGGTPLPTKPDKNAFSYWVTRAEPAQPKERFLKRF